MVPEWITAIATSIAAAVGAITAIVSAKKRIQKKKKDRDEVFRKLSRYMKWLNQTDAFLKNTFFACDDTEKVENMVEKIRAYIPNGEPADYELENMIGKAGYKLSKHEECQIEEFCDYFIGFICLYDYLQESMLDESSKPLSFKRMKKQLKDGAPKEKLFELGKTEDSKFSEYIFAYIAKLTEQWKEIENDRKKAG